MDKLAHNIHEVIDQLESNVPEWLEQEDPADDYEEVAPVFNRFGHVGDGDRLHVDFEKKPNQIIVVQPEDMVEALKILMRRLDNDKNAHRRKDNNDYISYALNHEKEHGEFMDAIGVQDIRYGVEVRREYKPHSINGDKEFYRAEWRYNAFTTTEHPFSLEKVLLAMVYTYPEKPSTKDMEAAYELGYRSVQDVYDRSLQLKNIPQIKPLSLKNENSARPSRTNGVFQRFFRKR